MSRTATDKVRYLPRFLDNTKMTGVAAGSAGLPSCSSCLFLGLGRPNVPLGKNALGCYQTVSSSRFSGPQLQEASALAAHATPPLRLVPAPQCAAGIALSWMVQRHVAVQVAGNMPAGVPSSSETFSGPQLLLASAQAAHAAPPQRPAPGPLCAAGIADTPGHPGGMSKICWGHASRPDT